MRATGMRPSRRPRRLKPDLVLMDIGMPGCDGIEATRLIKAELPETKIVMVTVSDDDEDVFDAIKWGADGYLLKDMSEDELSSTLEAVAAGKPALSPALAARIVEEFARTGRAADKSEAAALTPRESEVLRLVAAGLDEPGDRSRAGRHREHDQLPREEHPRQAASEEPRAGCAPTPLDLGLAEATGSRQQS